MDNRRSLGYLIAQVVAAALGILYQAFMWNKELPNNAYIMTMKYIYSIVPLIIPQLTFWYWEAGMLEYVSKWPFIIMVFVNTVTTVVSVGGIYADYFKFIRIFFANAVLTSIFSFVTTTYTYIKHDHLHKGRLITLTLASTLFIDLVNIAGLVIIEQVQNTIWLWYIYYFTMVIITNLQSIIVCVDYLRNHHNYATIPNL